MAEAGFDLKKARVLLSNDDGINDNPGTEPIEVSPLQKEVAFAIADPNRRGYVDKAQLERVLNGLTVSDAAKRQIMEKVMTKVRTDENIISHTEAF